MARSDLTHQNKNYNQLKPFKGSARDALSLSKTGSMFHVQPAHRALLHPVLNMIFPGKIVKRFEQILICGSSMGMSPHGIGMKLTGQFCLQYRLVSNP